MRWFNPIRWGDHDRYFGPFTYARSKDYKPLGIYIRSSVLIDGESCYLWLSAFGHTLIVSLPPIIRTRTNLVRLRTPSDGSSAGIRV